MKLPYGPVTPSGIFLKGSIRGSDLSPVVQEIRSVLENARSNVARQVNSELLNTYWNTGRIICEYEQTLPERADYGKQTLRAVSKELTNEFGKGFSVANIQFMRRFYQAYQIQQTGVCLQSERSRSPCSVVILRYLSL